MQRCGALTAEFSARRPLSSTFLINHERTIHHRIEKSQQHIFWETLGPLYARIDVYSIDIASRFEIERSEDPGSGGSAPIPKKHFDRKLVIFAREENNLPVA